MKMGSKNYSLVLILGLLALIGSTNAQLQLGFYARSCPKAEKIIWKFIHDHIPTTPSLAAALLRVHFHDCFIRGCDASVLVNSTKTNPAEKSAIPNFTLRGFGFIDTLKSLVEAECPGVVSCADIIALTARDSVQAIGGPYWNVPTGRRDGVISNATEALFGLPAPFHNLTTLLTTFANLGLDANDLVVLSGAHTIGISHCSSISTRLFNFTGKGDQDPALDSEYVTNLKSHKCKSINDNTTRAGPVHVPQMRTPDFSPHRTYKMSGPALNTTLIDMDPGSRNTFDVGYYKQVLKRRGLFTSDDTLLDSSVTRSIINQQLQSPQKFFIEFGKSMEKMGRINVLTGTQGQIRKHCAIVNS